MYYHRNESFSIKFGTVVLLFLASFFLSSSDKTLEYTPNYQNVVILKVDRPKYWRVVYQVKSTGEIRKARSTYCSTWKNLEVDKEYYLDIKKKNCEITKF